MKLRDGVKWNRGRSGSWYSGAALHAMTAMANAQAAGIFIAAPSVDPERPLDRLERDALGFRQEAPDEHELQHHHHGKAGECRRARRIRDDGERPADHRCPE